MVFTFAELFDMVLVILAVGFIFKGAFGSRPQNTENYDPLEALQKPKKAWLDDFWHTALLVAPAIIVHEFGHKFTAMFMGIPAEFHAHYLFLALGVVFKLVNFPLIFIPAYVAFPAAGVSAFGEFIIAFAGPLMNLVMWLIPLAYLKYAPLRKKKNLRWYNDPVVIGTFARINMWLFFFNLIPIPPFDGYSVFSGLIRMFFG